MSATFLHGIETTEMTIGATVVQQVKSAVIGLVGTAPIQSLATEYQTVNKPVLISSDVDAAKYFGEETDGYTIPAAIRAIQSAGYGTIVVVNVFDPTVHKTGTVPDPALVTSADIVGTVTTAGVRTGAKAFRNARTLFGFDPRILIAPGFSQLGAVTTELAALADLLRGVCLIDVPVGATVQQVIEGRGTAGTLALTSTSERVFYCYPHVYVENADGDDVLEPYSQHLAGIIAATDNDKGYWWSPSNKTLSTVTGLERSLTARINESTSEVNQLNAVGVVTVFSDWGSGFRTWGNRSAAWPNSSKPTTFMSIRRTADVIEDSVEQASAEFMDHPLRRGLIDTLVETGNSYMRTLKGRGAVNDGYFTYDSARNPSDELANGHLTLCYRFMPPAPLERLTYEAYLDLSLATIK